jgi:hypothetical protein
MIVNKHVCTHDDSLALTNIYMYLRLLAYMQILDVTSKCVFSFMIINMNVYESVSARKENVYV